MNSSRTKRSSRSQITLPHHSIPFRLSPIAALVAGVTLFGGSAVCAADDPKESTLVAQAAPEAAPAAEQPRVLEGVTVRSRNRIEKVQDVPLSVSVINGKELDRELAYDIGGITKRAANVTRNVGNSRTFGLSIRGVGKVTQTESQDTSVGVIVDGVNYAYSPLASFDFFDVESVEVARGPQGTLLGKNSTMGVIVVNTRKPSFVPDASWSVAFGQRKTLISQFAGGGPVIDDLLAVRGTLTVNKGRGAWENKYNPDQSYFDRDRVAGRVQLLLTPDPDLSVRFSADLQPKAGEYYNGQTVKTQLPATYTNGVTTKGTTNDIEGKLARRWFTDQKITGGYSYNDDYLNSLSPNLDNQRALVTETKGASVEVKWKVGEYDLTSITAYRDYHFHARNDEGTPFDVSLNGGGKVDAYRQTSQELRLASKTGGFVDYQVGALYFRNTVDFGQGGYNAGWGSDAGAWFANNLQYSTLDRAVNPDGSTSAGRYLLVNSLDKLNKGQAQYIKNSSFAVFGQADWHLSEALTLTTGARLTRENRKNKADSTIVDNGAAGVELNPVSISGVPTGGFNSVAFTSATNTDNTAGNLLTNTAAQLALADKVASKYFGAASYAALTQDQKKQVAAAKAIRVGQIGTLWNLLSGPDFRKTQPGFTVSPSYKINPDQTTYVALQYGEKGGVSQVVNGRPQLAGPEKVASVEWGLKSSLLNKTLFINSDIFFTQIKGYQQAVVVPDPLNPSATVSYTGNADKVHVYGLEVDGAYSGIRNTTVRFSGAYNIAKYKDFKNSPVPAEVQPGSTSGYQDVSGQYLSGASRLTFNVGAEYRVPVFRDKLFHTSFNTAYLGSFNSDNNLSSYARIKGASLTDASIGLGRLDGKFDFSIIVKNLFNDDTPQNRTWNNYVPRDPRWIGFQFSGKI